MRGQPPEILRQRLLKVACSRSWASWPSNGVPGLCRSHPESRCGASWGNPGAILGSLGVILVSLWCHLGTSLGSRLAHGTTHLVCMSGFGLRADPSLFQTLVLIIHVTCFVSRVVLYSSVSLRGQVCFISCFTMFFVHWHFRPGKAALLRSSHACHCSSRHFGFFGGPCGHGLVPVFTRSAPQNPPPKVSQGCLLAQLGLLAVQWGSRAMQEPSCGPFWSRRSHPEGRFGASWGNPGAVGFPLVPFWDLSGVPVGSWYNPSCLYVWLGQASGSKPLPDA